MANAIAVEFDDATVAAVDALALAISTACGNGVTTIASFGVPAHLTLTSYDELPMDRALPALDAFAATLGEAELAVSSLAVFPDLVSGSVLFLAPVVTPALLALHQGSLKALARLGAPCWEQYQPERWVPHVTLAMGLREPQLAKTVAYCAERWKPLSARMVGLKLVAFPPVATLKRWPLQFRQA